MKRGNFLKGLFAIPFAAKAMVEDKGLPKDKDGFYVDKKEFEKEVREREYNRSASQITLSYPNTVSAWSVTGTCGYNYTSAVIGTSFKWCNGSKI